MPLELKEIGVQVPLSKIKHSAQKVRRETAAQGIDNLVSSMVKHGQIHAVSVIRNDDGSCEVINGHRRAAAGVLGKLPSLRANVYAVPPGEEDNRELLIQQHLYAANMAEPLLPIERARGYEALMEDLDFDVDQVAAAFDGETPETVADTLRYLNIDERVLDVVQAHPEKFTEAHLRVLADYASAGTKGSWRMKPDEQYRVAKEIVDQVDKQVAKDPRKLETRIKAVVNERREAEKKKNAASRKALADPVKVLFKAIEAVESSVKALRDTDLSTIAEIDAGDKGSAVKRVLDCVDQLTVFHDDRLAKLKVRKAAS